MNTTNTWDAEIEKILKRLQRGEAAGARVVDIKSWFGVERRGSRIVEMILDEFRQKGIGIRGRFDDSNATKDDDRVSFTLLSLERHSSDRVFAQLRKSLKDSSSLRIERFLRDSQLIACLDVAATVETALDRMGHENLDFLPVVHGVYTSHPPRPYQKPKVVRQKTYFFRGFLSWKTIAIQNPAVDIQAKVEPFVDRMTAVSPKTDLLTIYDRVQASGCVAVQEPSDKSKVYVVDRSALAAILLQLSLPTLISASASISMLEDDDQ